MIEMVIDGVVGTCEDWEAEPTGELDAVSLWYLDGDWKNIIVKELVFTVEKGKAKLVVKKP